jgi:hypothetical protein
MNLLSLSEMMLSRNSKQLTLGMKKMMKKFLVDHLLRVACKDPLLLQEELERMALLRN